MHPLTWAIVGLAALAGPPACHAAPAPLQHGVILFLPETPEEAVGQLELIEADGFNMVNIASWVWTVPTEGSKLRAVVDAALDWCDRNGMSVWLLHNIQYGSSGEGGDVDEALVDPVAGSRRSLSVWAEALKGHSSVVGVLLGNEVSPGGVEMFEGHPQYLAHFRDWLRKCHGDISVLNARWGADFATFDDVVPCSEKERGYVDMRRFNGECFARFYNAITRELLRPVLGDGVSYGSKGGASPYILRQIPEYNVASWDDLLANWPLWKTKLTIDTTHLSVFNSELHLYHDDFSFGPGRELSRYRYLTSALLGEWMTASFAWGAWSKPQIAQVHAATPGILADLRRLEPALRLFNDQPPAFSVLVTEANEDGVQDHPPLELAYAYAATTGLPWSFVVDLDLARLRTPALVVSSRFLTQRAANDLVALSGETQLIFVSAVPASDEYGMPLDAAVRSELMRRGQIIEDWSSLRSVLPSVSLPAACTDVVDVDYLWWSKERGHHEFAVSYPRVEWRRVDDGPDTFVALVNHTRQSQEVMLPASFAQCTVTDLATGNVLPDTRVTLGELEIKLLRIRR